MFTIANHPDSPRGNPFPASKLVENKLRLDIWQLQKSGALSPGAEAAIALNGIPVGSVRGLGGGLVLAELAGLKREIRLVFDQPMHDVWRWWFQCPACEKRCRHIYLPELQCRCLGLEHMSRHRMLWGNTARVSWLRRRLGADERPFAELPQPKRRGRRYWRMAARIAAEEKELLAGMRRFTEAAEMENRQDAR